MRTGDAGIVQQGAQRPGVGLGEAAELQVPFLGENPLAQSGQLGIGHAGEYVNRAVRDGVGAGGRLASSPGGHAGVAR